MNNIISNFPQIVQQAQQRGLPLKKRAILREYLQAKIINHYYANVASSKLSFVGGTSLRLLRGLPRFSEDIDFDNLGITSKKITDLTKQVVQQLRLENIKLDLQVTQKNYKNYLEFKFFDLLKPLGISTDPREKLMIKVDYSDHWLGQTPEVILLNQYGLIEQVVTNPIDQLLVQKLGAYVQRKQTQPRDIFDIVWLFAQGARLDQEFVQANKLGNIVEKAKDKFAREGVSNKMMQKLQPFLLNPTEISKLSIFGEVLKQL